MTYTTATATRIDLLEWNDRLLSLAGYLALGRKFDAGVAAMLLKPDENRERLLHEARDVAEIVSPGSKDIDTRMLDIRKKIMINTLTSKTSKTLPS